MRYGVALQECVIPDHDRTLRALDEFAGRSRMPDILPLWSREWKVDKALVRDVRARGVEPVIYVEVADPFTASFDAVALFACRIGEGTVVRLNQEMDGNWGAPWQAWTSDQYVMWWDRVSTILHGEGALTYWCPSRPRRAADEGYWPGKADVVGFDRYAWDADSQYPPDSFEGPVSQCQRLAPGTPIWVGEHGSHAGVPKRAERLRALEDVPGLDVVVVMNLIAQQPTGGSDDWRWTASMERAFREM